jgi:RNA polymerase sigma-70 factor, ECF subfamily
VGTVPDVSSVSLAENLLAGTTSPSMKVAQSELKIRLEKLVNGMDPMDREILVLRHFEELTNEDVSRLLGIKKSAASNRYVRALGRLRKLLDAE